MTKPNKVWTRVCGCEPHVAVRAATRTVDTEPGLLTLEVFPVCAACEEPLAHLPAGIRPTVRRPWIAVEERKPEAGEAVIVQDGQCLGLGMVKDTTGRFAFDVVLRFPAGHSGVPREVIAWMPYPSL